MESRHGRKPYRPVFVRAGSYKRIFTTWSRSVQVEGSGQNYLYEFRSRSDSLGRPCELCRLKRRCDDVDEKHSTGICAYENPCEQYWSGSNKNPYQSRGLANA